MKELLQNSLFFGVMLSFATYEAGALLRKKFPYYESAFDCDSCCDFFSGSLSY